MQGPMAMLLYQLSIIMHGIMGQYDICQNGPQKQWGDIRKQANDTSTCDGCRTAKSCRCPLFRLNSELFQGCLLILSLFLPLSWKWKMGPSNIGILSFQAIFHFRDCGERVVQGCRFGPESKPNPGNQYLDP